MLTARQMLILQVIIDDFIKSAQPVGSRTLSKKDNVSYSPATVGNDMADLKALDNIETTNASSGREPSEKGYRYYVYHLIPFPTKDDKINMIEDIIKEGYFEFEQIVQKSAEILSDITNYTSFILGPAMFETR